MTLFKQCEKCNQTDGQMDRQIDRQVDRGTEYVSFDTYKNEFRTNT